MFGHRSTAPLLAVIAIALACSSCLAGEPAPAAAAPAAPGKTLSLEEAIGIALRNNPSVEIANQEINADMGIVQQANSAIYPRVTASVSRTSAIDLADSESPSSGAIWSTQVSFTQPLYSWGALGKGIVAAGKLLSSSRKLYVRAQDEVAFAARRAYFGVLTSQEAVKVQYEVLATAKEQQRIATLRQEAGVAPKYDVLAAEARVARVEQQMAAAEGALSIAWANLSLVLGVPVATDTTLESAAAAGEEMPSLTELVAYAEEGRPDLLAARALVSANEARLKVVRTRSLPTFVGLMTYSRGGPTTVGGGGGSEVTVTAEQAMIGLAANWNIYTGGQVSGEVKEAEARLEQSRQGLRQLELGVEAEVKSAYYAIETARAQVTAAQKEVEQAQEAKRIADLRYQEGVSTSLEVLDAQTQLGDAKNRLIGATFNLSVARAELDLAAGRSLTQALPPGPRT